VQMATPRHRSSRDQDRLRLVQQTLPLVEFHSARGHTMLAFRRQ
jgi:hypothetical protein